MSNYHLTTPGGTMIGRWSLKDLFELPELPSRVSLAGQLSDAPYLYREDSKRKEPRIKSGLYWTIDDSGRLWVINAHPSKSGHFQKIDICCPKVVVTAPTVRM